MKQCPKVRIVILNYNGGEMTRACLQHLQDLDWPKERLDIVLVDNASSDGLADSIEHEMPTIRVIRSYRNRGFAGGNNLALADLGDCNYVALVNNDAFVEPDWLKPLITLIDSDPNIGAVNSKILFADRFVDVDITSPAEVPTGPDARHLGVRVLGIEADGTNVWRRCQFASGFWGHEYDGTLHTEFRWTGAKAKLRAPITTNTTQISLKLAASSTKTATVSSGSLSKTCNVGPSSTRVTVPLSGKTYDVVNNVGSIVFEDGFGADRGYLELDTGQFDLPEEIFSFCGASVLFRRQFLEDVGLFDEHFFVYYEDTDLAWRGRTLGWRYVYAPDSIVRHIHAASTTEGSALFTHYVERNRLLMLAKNAPWGLFLRQALRYIFSTASYGYRDVLKPMLHCHRPSTTLTRRRVHAYLSFLRLLPAMLAERHRLKRRRQVSNTELASWFVQRTVVSSEG